MIDSKNIVRSIDNSCKEYALSQGIHHVIATVSGGPDSIAMLAAMHSAGLTLTAAHCNFHLRGDESMRDQMHVEKICNQIGVRLIVKDFDINAFLSDHKGHSVEMACRETRHEWFSHLLLSLDADRIATGHNADDNIETLFLNLLRGSGSSGLKGMLPDTGSIWRPLLSFHRHHIMEYLRIRQLSHIVDSTNLESDYRRNFLRNDIIPMLRSRWSGFDKALDRSIVMIREENKVVADAVMRSLPHDSNRLPASVVLAFPAPELLVRRFIEPAGPFTTTAAEVIAAIKADKPHVRKWKLRDGSVTLRNRTLTIEKP